MFTFPQLLLIWFIAHAYKEVIMKKSIILMSLLFGSLGQAQERPTVEEFLAQDGVYDEKELSSADAVKQYLSKNIAAGVRAGVNGYGTLEAQSFVGSTFFDESLELGLSAAGGTGYYTTTYRVGPYAQFNIRFEDNKYFVRLSREYTGYSRAEYNLETSEYDNHSHADWQTHTAFGVQFPHADQEAIHEYYISTVETEDFDGNMKTFYNIGFGARFK